MARGRAAAAGLAMSVATMFSQHLGVCRDGVLGLEGLLAVALAWSRNTYSPSAVETAPSTSPAAPAVRIVEKVGEQRIFMTLPTAVDAYLDWYRDRHGTEPPGLQRP